MSALAAGSVVHWLGLLGKFLVFLAGLAILLDLIGPHQIKKWSQSAGRQCGDLAESLRRLKTVRQLEGLLAHWANCVATERIPRKTPYCTDEEFAQVTATAREKYLSEQPSPRISWMVPKDPVNFAESWQVKEAVCQLLIKNSKLHDDEREALEKHRRELSRHEQKVIPLIQWLFLLTLIGAIWLYREMPKEVGNSLPFLMALFAMVGFYPMCIIVLFTSTRVVLTYKLARATVRFRLAHFVLKLVGEDQTGRPMRWAALAAFIVGSLLDLVASW